MRRIEPKDLDLLNLILAHDQALASTIELRLKLLEQTLEGKLAPPPGPSPLALSLKDGDLSADGRLRWSAASQRWEPAQEPTKASAEPQPLSKTKLWEARIAAFFRGKPEGVKVPVGELRQALGVEGFDKSFQVALHNLVARKAIRHNGQKGTGSAYGMVWGSK